jgi:hypothetical protein
MIIDCAYFTLLVLFLLGLLSERCCKVTGLTLSLFSACLFILTNYLNVRNVSSTYSFKIFVCKYY